ncbi:MAG: aminotransferase class V-fold PLP-dependent enzyme, partial [Clostridia bacterium]|nr:aminotransferase class V-fold PLP-dependent enzyme [Clostridia bacterium]
NNETGAKYQVKEAADIIHRASPDGAVHLDATQSYMKFPFSVSSVGADMITVSSHKIEGPKGVGALYVGAGLLKSKGLSPIVFGGGQEDGLRSGTENVPGIGAFAEAARVYYNALPQRYQAVSALREYLVEKVSAVCGIEVNLPSGDFAPHIVSLTVRGMKSETVLNDLSGRKICVSAGSACSSHDKRLSSALLAFGKTPDEADSTIRVSLSFRNTKEELDTFVAALVDVIRVRAKKLSLD